MESSGSAVLGPVGQPGAYYGNLRVALRRKRDEQLFGAKDYRVGADIPAGAARADFTLLVETLEAPFISQRAAEDYEVIVGFKQSGADTATPKPEKKRRKPAAGMNEGRANRAPLIERIFCRRTAAGFQCASAPNCRMPSATKSLPPATPPRKMLSATFVAELAAAARTSATACASA